MARFEASSSMLTSSPCIFSFSKFRIFINFISKFKEFFEQRERGREREREREDLYKEMQSLENREFRRRTILLIRAISIAADTFGIYCWSINLWYIGLSLTKGIFIFLIKLTCTVFQSCLENETYSSLTLILFVPTSILFTFYRSSGFLNVHFVYIT